MAATQKFWEEPQLAEGVSRSSLSQLPSNARWCSRSRLLDGGIFVLALSPEQLDSASDEEIEAGYWLTKRINDLPVRCRRRRKAGIRSNSTDYNTQA